MEIKEREAPEGAKLNSVAEAPCYYPTVAEFEEPLKYIASIRPEAERYGICRICPPSGWKPPFAHKPDKLRFSTKEQDLVRVKEAKLRRRVYAGSFSCRNSPHTNLTVPRSCAFYRDMSWLQLVSFCRSYAFFVHLA